MTVLQWTPWCSPLPIKAILGMLARTANIHLPFWNKRKNFLPYKKWPFHFCCFAQTSFWNNVYFCSCCFFVIFLFLSFVLLLRDQKCVLFNAFVGKGQKIVALYLVLPFHPSFSLFSFGAWFIYWDSLDFILRVLSPKVLTGPKAWSVREF